MPRKEILFYYIIFIFIATFLYELELDKFYETSNIPFLDSLAVTAFFAIGVFIIQVILNSIWHVIDEDKIKTKEQKITIVFLTGILLFLYFWHFPRTVESRVLIERMDKIYNKIDNVKDKSDFLYSLQDLSDTSEFSQESDDYKTEKRLY